MTKVRPKKHLGQHFLKDPTIAKRIADGLSMEGYRRVLEIGPGMGVLTQFLLEKETTLFVIEIDPESVAYLKAHYLSLSNRVIEGDFLTFDTRTVFDQHPFAVIGNFPYNISSQIVFRVLALRDQIPEVCGMFQKEVAERICATPGGKTYGILSVLTQAFYEATYLFTVSETVFAPPPKVKSGAIQLKRRKNYQLACDERFFFRVVKTAFNQRRKTLRNSLKGLGLSDNLKEDAIFGRRPEQLSVREFVMLTQKIADDTL